MTQSAEADLKREPSKPTHWVYRTEGQAADGAGGYRLNIGAGWLNADGSLTVIMDSIPADGRIHLEPRLFVDTNQNGGNKS